jgi:hypothetical protein
MGKFKEMDLLRQEADIQEQPVPWIGLTDDEANAIIKTNWGEMKGGPLVLNQRYIRSIEAKLKEKNRGCI